MSDSITHDPGLQIASTIPLGRLGDPSEVANVVQMMVKTGYLTGQDVVLSGGLHWSLYPKEALGQKDTILG